LLQIQEIGAIRGDGISGVNQVGRLNAYLCLNAPRSLAVNSRNAIKNVSALGVQPERLHYLPNSIDTDHFRTLERKSIERINLLGLGRFSEPKRFDRFLAIIDHLRKTSSHPLRVLLVGDGPLEEDLKNQAAHMGLTPGWVEFYNQIFDPLPMYQRADIFFLTSDWEGTPNVVLEAMACALPVVSTNVGGVPEIIEHGETGFLFHPDDNAGMVSIIQELMNNQVLRKRIGRQARDYVVKNHSLTILPQSLTALYTTTLSI
jgi:glycosyltransferase involved in cell wall biosynthesis